jgi:nuclear GTP-binding protein
MFAQVCPVAAEPGWTKDLQSVAIERGLKIIDSPGIIFDYSEPSDPSSQGTSRASHILLLNVLSASSISDPLQIAQSIVSRISHETLQEIYSLPPFWNQENGMETQDTADLTSIATTFLTMLALTTGRLLPGGAPNLEAAATQLLRDWNSGKIPFFSPVPEVHPSLKPSDAPGAENVGEMKIVNEWKPAFDLGGLWEEADKNAWGEQGSDHDDMNEDG